MQLLFGLQPKALSATKVKRVRRSNYTRISVALAREHQEDVNAFSSLLGASAGESDCPLCLSPSHLACRRTSGHLVELSLVTTSTASPSATSAVRESAAGRLCSTAVSTAVFSHTRVVRRNPSALSQTAYHTQRKSTKSRTRPKTGKLGVEALPDKRRLSV